MVGVKRLKGSRRRRGPMSRQDVVWYLRESWAWLFGTFGFLAPSRIRPNYEDGSTSLQRVVKSSLRCPQSVSVSAEARLGKVETKLTGNEGVQGAPKPAGPKKGRWPPNSCGNVRGVSRFAM